MYPEFHPPREQTAGPPWPRAFISIVPIALFLIASPVSAQQPSAAAEAEAEDRIQIDVSLEPAADLIGPDRDVAILRIRTSVEARLRLTLDAPPPGVLISTDFPIVEGTRLLDAEAVTTDRKFEMRYLFPIRGQYSLRVRATAAGSGPAPTVADGETTFQFILHENPAEVQNLFWLLGALASFGLLAGVVLGRSQVYRSAQGALLSLLLVGLSVIGTLAPPRPLLAHDPAAHASDEVSDFARVRHAGYELRLKLLPSRALAAHDVPAEPDAIRTALAQGTLIIVPENEGRLAQVGDMAFLAAELRQGGRRIQNVHYSLSFQHIEDEQEVFAAETTGPNGRLLWGQQFFDGAEHRITLRATPANGARFAPLELELIAGVRSISPPTQVMVKSLLLLLAVVAAAMIVGYVVSVRLFAPSALRFSRTGD